MLRLNAGLSTPTPDIGFVGFYTDGQGFDWGGEIITWGGENIAWDISDAYTGFFRDSTDGIWKVFESYAPNPDNDYEIDINDSTFKIADFQTDKLYVNNINVNNNIGIGTNFPTSKLDINSDTIRIRNSKTPSSPTDEGNKGDICWDSSYIYVCIDANTWVRSLLSTW